MKEEQKIDKCDEILADLKQKIENNVVAFLKLQMAPNWKTNHRVTYNAKLKCLSSNILFQLQQRDETAI